jgi:hypothetical protein
MGMGHGAWGIGLVHVPISEIGGRMSLPLGMGNGGLLTNNQ